MFPLLKNPTCFDAVVMEASFEIIFWDVPEKLCELWQDAWLIGDDLVGRGICLTSQQCLLAMLEKWKRSVDNRKMFGALLIDVSKASWLPQPWVAHSKTKRIWF